MPQSHYFSPPHALPVDDRSTTIGFYALIVVIKYEPLKNPIAFNADTRFTPIIPGMSLNLSFAETVKFIRNGSISLRRHAITMIRRES